ncbi:MAG: hypothetical protein IJO22_05395 [Oscillospiraceae bacterium]|nr:hypothetical protein [Oscillospiraceae bacterium]
MDKNYDKRQFFYFLLVCFDGKAKKQIETKMRNKVKNAQKTKPKFGNKNKSLPLGKGGFFGSAEKGGWGQNKKGRKIPPFFSERSRPFPTFFKIICRPCCQLRRGVLR